MAQPKQNITTTAASKKKYGINTTKYTATTNPHTSDTIPTVAYEPNPGGRTGGYTAKTDQPTSTTTLTVL